MPYVSERDCYITNCNIALTLILTYFNLNILYYVDLVL